MSLNATDLLHFKRCDPGCAYVRPCVFIYFYIFYISIGITLGVIPMLRLGVMFMLRLGVMFMLR